jgi:hypothetical protein
MFGQAPRVGISSLHLDTELLDTLATEAQLNQVAEYTGMMSGQNNNVVDAAEEELVNNTQNNGMSGLVDMPDEDDDEDEDDEADVANEATDSHNVNETDVSDSLTQLGEPATAGNQSRQVAKTI